MHKVGSFVFFCACSFATSRQHFFFCSLHYLQTSQESLYSFLLSSLSPFIFSLQRESSSRKCLRKLAFFCHWIFHLLLSFLFFFTIFCRVLLFMASKRRRFSLCTTTFGLPWNQTKLQVHVSLTILVSFFFFLLPSNVHQP